MKKFFIFFLTLFVIFNFSSCGKDEKNNNLSQEEIIKEKVDEQEEQEEPDPIYNDLIGNLELNNSEKTKVKDLIKKDAKELSNYLNELTLLKFKDKEKLSFIEKYAAIYKESRLNRGLDFKEVSHFYIKGNGLEAMDEMSRINYQNNKKILKTFEDIKKIFPIKELNKLQIFMPFSTSLGKPTTGGFMTTQDKNYVVGINVEFDITFSGYALYHEYGHFISINSSQIKNGQSKVGDYFDYHDVDFKDNSYMKKYYEKFWKNLEKIHKINDGGHLFYVRHMDDFVTIYASTSFLEDFAESFGHFIIEKDEDKKGKIKQKIDFFKSYSEFVKLKEEIKILCNANNIHPNPDDKTV